MKDVLILYEFRKMPRTRTNEACVSKSVVSWGNCSGLACFGFLVLLYCVSSFVFALWCLQHCVIGFVYCVLFYYDCLFRLNGFMCILGGVVLIVAVVFSMCLVFVGFVCVCVCVCVCVSLCVRSAWGALGVSTSWAEVLLCRAAGMCGGHCQRVVGMLCKCSGLFR